MPIYEYQCQACKHELEALQKISDEPLSVCPRCHEAQLRRKISAAAFRLKGGGWYETDFKKGSKKNLAGEGASTGDSGAAASSSDAAAKASGPAASSDAAKPATTPAASGS